MTINELQKAELTVYRMLRLYADLYEDRTAIEYESENGIQKVSFRKYFEDCCRAANYFKSLGLMNTAISISGKSSYAYSVAFIAAMFDGNTAFPINPELEQSIVESVLERRSASFLVYDEEYPVMCSVAEKQNLKSITFAEFLENIKDLSSDFEERAEIDPHDTCLNLLTSGTTGIPKIVMCNHFLFAMHGYDYPGERLLLLFPFHHLGGIHYFGNMIGRGKTACLSYFSKAIQHVKMYQADVLLTVPALLKVLVKLDKAKMIDISCFKTVGTGAASPNLEAFAYLQSKGINVANMYGATEGGGEYSTCGDIDAPLKSIGKDNPFFETKLTSEGELLMKGRTVMNGYYKDGKATEEVLKDGWYYTGDSAYMDENGYYFINGRIRNLIVLSNGENVSPESIETELSQCDSIQMCMVRQQEDQIVVEVYYGEKKEEDKEREIREYVDEYNKHASSFHRIMQVIFREVPFKTTSNGKMIRK